MKKTGIALAALAALSVAAASPADAWEDFLRHGLLGPQPLIANADVGISSVACGGRATPLVSNRRGAGGTSWVASLRNSYGPYARAETDIVRMSRWPRSAAQNAIRAPDGEKRGCTA